jgi:hypothetical protein
MDLRDALTQIAEIRQTVARAETFRGYRAAPVAFSGVLALAAAVLQALWLPDPASNLTSYLMLWSGAALVSVLVTGLFMVLHCWHSTSSMTRTLALLAISQFAPCLVAGGLLTYVLYQQAPQALWMLPGLWAMLFSLGVFASYRLLPKATFWVAVYYLAAGACCLAWAQGDGAFSPWAMGLTFGIGQLLAAAILYWTLEREHEKQGQDA